MTKPLNKEERLDRDRRAREIEEAIEAMSANGLSPQQISQLTGIRPERLYRRYRETMMKGGARRLHEVAESAYLMSVGGPEKNWRQADAGMAKFWLERHGGPSWAVPDKDASGGPDLSRLTVAQLIDLERALRPLARGPVLIEQEPVEVVGDVETGGDAEPRSGGERVDASGAGDLAD